MTRRSPIVLACAVAALSTSARAQTRAGGEFRVNSYTSNVQFNPLIGFDASGGFVVTWDSADQDGSGFGVFGRRFSRAGLPLGGDFLVNQTTSGNQNQWPSGASRAPSGAFVVTWRGYTTMEDVMGRRFDAAGNPSGGEFRVNTYTTSFQTVAAVAHAGTGAFVIVWQSRYQDGSGEGIFAQRYDASGTALGAEFRVNTTTAGAQILLDVAADALGNFVVVWTSEPASGVRDVFGQQFDASGAALGSEFQVNTYTTHIQSRAQVARAPAGSFVVVWTSYGQDGSGHGVFGQRFDAGGARLGAEFRVNTYTTLDQNQARVATDAAGSFVVAWRSYHDGSITGVFAQRYAPSGAAVGGEFRVNTDTSGNQGSPALRTDAHGNFVVAWHSQESAYSPLFDIKAQRFGGLRPFALSADAGGSGVLEPDETAVIAPSWHNFHGAPLTFGGAALSFDGPPGPVYSLLDAQARYGTVADDADRSCSSAADCYAVRIMAAARPSQHWDATLLEQLQPAEQHGQLQRWTLHVGDSFTDVPRTNPFYRFVETLLHHAVTGGCGQGLYCPQAVTTREQIAVFVLVAREGSAYAPPACATPVFADVPASSPFCRWIEELFRRGVAGGCGGGNYCPGDAVPREQMAVFVLRTLDPALSPPACTTPVFADVPASSPFCRWIEELFRRGVASGCGGGNYCPTQPVTREQMGVFLGATFGLTLYGP